MIPVLTAAEMREADRRAIEERGVPGLVLMENAGAAVAAALRQRFEEAESVAVLCGKGNNGGDGFVAARQLLDLATDVYLLARHGDVKGDAAAHLQKLLEAGGAVHEVPDQAAWEAVRERALGCDVLVDAVFGTGLREAPAGLSARVLHDAALAAAAGLPVLAVDVPSGLSSDTGETPWESVVAALTVTFAAAKHCHALPPACDRAGALRVADIGIPRDLVEGTRLWLLEIADARAAWPARTNSAHKGTFGHVLVVAGSMGKTGAAILSALGALRSGAGLVTVATPEPCLPLVAVHRPEVMTEALAAAPGGGVAGGAVERALELAAARDAAVVGPGIGQSEEARAFVRALVRRCQAPMVVDADALNAFGAAGGEKAAPELLRRGQPTVLTPHPGEMARLLGAHTRDVQSRRVDAARGLAERTGAVVVLKGERTVIARPDGTAAVNPTGNPGMATGGTGDVLAGVVGALLARGCDPWAAATAAAYAHGLAGDLAAEQLGQEAMLAGDLADALSGALRALEVGHR
jgi:ADP-dependent NAD(P)H-hydrate dehydratase / NAD(P)H-hydrate epimerase